MALALVRNLQNVWPFSVLKPNDLKLSNELVGRLGISEHTKQFVYAVREPETGSVIYILSAQSLSEWSALDVECLIREVKPDAVIAQVDVSTMTEKIVSRGGVDNSVPTSSFEVLKRCFLEKVNKDKYESLAGELVLEEIFGVGFHGHFLAARRVAQEIGSSFLVLEFPSGKNSDDEDTSGEVEAVPKFQGLASSLVPQKLCSVGSLSLKRFHLTNDVQSQMVKLLCPYIDKSILRLSPSSSVSEAGSKSILPLSSYEAPQFAQSFYPLLVDLYNIFIDLPSMGKVLAHAQKMLYDVNKGVAVDAKDINEVYAFRIAVEGLRISFNNAGRLPINKIRNPNLSKIQFSDLPVEDKSQALFAQALRSQTKKFNTVVAVVDASCLAGLRKHWNTPVPVEVNELVGQLITDCEGEGGMSNYTEKKSLISGKPLVAVGAGATAVLGASSLSKVVPASTFMKVVTSKVPASILLKVVTLKVPSSLQLFISQTHKTVGLSLSKILGTSKMVVPSLASSGVKSTTVLKATASAEKFRAVAHSVIASAENTSISAMRTAFYHIMRKRQVRPIGVLPWATFGCSIATCAGLFAYGDGIECAAESVPEAPSIASLGRGIQGLHLASQEVMQRDGTKVQRSIDSLLYSLRKVRVQ
ncbi:uncharacterized protein LOC126801863 [Argentina anserina]|uniref:uncharacterized protein LOC126801863 n=1 Tax=Argentina anserina TaxID=57926 RepID=UPI0021768AC0|nr:uncharacterized protein LOC126801863 [Potentilla anserina]